MTPEEMTKQSLVTALEENGLTFNQDVLADPRRLADMKSEEVATALGVDYNDEAKIERLRNAGIDTLFNRFVGEAYIGWLKSPKADELLEAGDWQVVDSTLENIDIQDELKAIRTGNLSYERGYVMNVLIPDNEPYVLKIVRDNKASKYAFRESVKHLKMARDFIEEQFLSKQVTLHSEERDTSLVIQEKLDPELWHSSRNSKELKVAVEAEENKKVLSKFIDQVASLYNQHGIMLDLEGDNVRLRLDDEGRLHIKVIDYGMFDKDAKYQVHDKIEKSAKRLDALKQLTQ